MTNGITNRRDAAPIDFPYPTGHVFYVIASWRFRGQSFQETYRYRMYVLERYNADADTWTEVPRPLFDRRCKNIVFVVCSQFPGSAVIYTHNM